MVELCGRILICVFNDEDVSEAEQNLRKGEDALNGVVRYNEDLVSYDLFAYVVGFECEFGYIGVRPCNGGLTRVY